MNLSEKKNLREKKITFVTGTDTGVGKTLLAALLLIHLRQSGCRALGMKPFCSGSLEDVKLLREAQDRELGWEEINPFYFAKPLAPLAAAAKGRTVPLEKVLEKIRRVENDCERLVIEGSGGLMVPLGEGYMVLDLIAKLDADVILVAPNKLGTINHTLLSVKALRAAGIEGMKIVLMGQAKPDLSARTNEKMLKKLLAKSEIQVFPLPFLGENLNKIGGFKESCKKVKKTLARLLLQT